MGIKHFVRIRDLKDQRFGYLLVLESAGTDKYSNALWLCKCKCGNEVIRPSYKLTRGHTKSCGCFRREDSANKLKGDKPWRNKHLHNRAAGATPEYRAWLGMKQRCYNVKYQQYDDYGGRGIIVCNEWRNSFENFLASVGEKPEPKSDYSIDRINNDGNYEPSNVRWATRQQQNRNKRRAVVSELVKLKETIGEYEKRFGKLPIEESSCGVLE